MRVLLIWGLQLAKIVGKSCRWQLCFNLRLMLNRVLAWHNMLVLYPFFNQNAKVLINTSLGLHLLLMPLENKLTWIVPSSFLIHLKLVDDAMLLDRLLSNRSHLHRVFLFHFYLRVLCVINRFKFKSDIFLAGNSGTIILHGLLQLHGSFFLGQVICSGVDQLLLLSQGWLSNTTFSWGPLLSLFFTFIRVSNELFLGKLRDPSNVLNLGSQGFIHEEVIRDDVSFSYSVECLLEGFWGVVEGRFSLLVAVYLVVTLCCPRWHHVVWSFFLLLFRLAANQRQILNYWPPVLIHM